MSTLLGIARPMASETGEWLSAHRTISRRRSGATPAAPMRTSVREVSGPAGTESSIPSKPRLSDSLCTITSSLPKATPSCAARIEITVARQLAWAARDSQPGVGATAPPPSAFGMSVTVDQPPGPSTRQRSPSSITAVAGRSMERALSGCSVRCLIVRWTASRIEVNDIAISSPPACCGVTLKVSMSLVQVGGPGGMTTLPAPDSMRLLTSQM